MQGRVLILAGGGGYTSYVYALAQVLHGKASLSFLAFKRDATKKL
jgi:hypothetical protein